MSDSSPPSSEPGRRETGPDLGEVFLEFFAIGASVKVSAIHAATGIEVSAVGPAGAARADLQRLAIRKLEQRLKREGLLPG